MKNYPIDYSYRSDCIYSSDLQLLPNPYHNYNNIKTDLGGLNVILSTNFIYFGDKHIDVPNNLKNIIPHRHEHYKPNEPYKSLIIDLFNDQKMIYGIGKIGKHNNINKKCKMRNVKKDHNIISKILFQNILDIKIKFFSIRTR